MIRVLVLYENEPDPAEYERHVELSEKVEGATFRHGKVFGSPMGEPKYAYYAEFEFPDRDAFKAAARTEEFAETGRHAATLGTPFEVLFADVS